MKYIYIIAIIFLAIIIIIGITIKLKSKKNKEKEKEEVLCEETKEITPNSEKIVGDYLQQFFPIPSKIYNNLYIMNKRNGLTSQIDHLVISTKGVFCIETKGQTGRIKGKIEDAEWIQYIWKRKVHYSLKNPIKQNERHIRELEEYIKNTEITNIVVFTNAKSIDIVSPSIFTLETLASYFALLEDKITVNKVNAIIKVIDAFSTETQITKEEHLKNIALQKIRHKNHQCPKCGGRLKLINSKYGKFYGCSNFPNCKYRKNIYKNKQNNTVKENE